MSKDRKDINAKYKLYRKQHNGMLRTVKDELRTYTTLVKEHKNNFINDYENVPIGDLLAITTRRKVLELSYKALLGKPIDDERLHRLVRINLSQINETASTLYEINKKYLNDTLELIGMTRKAAAMFRGHIG